MNNSQIEKVSQMTKNAIKRKSAFVMSNRPSDQGMKAEDIRRALYLPIIDDSFSAVSEIDRVIDGANEILASHDARLTSNTLLIEQLKGRESVSFASSDWSDTKPHRIYITTDMHNFGKEARVDYFNDGADDFEWRRDVTGNIIIFSNIRVAMKVYLK